MPSADPRSTNLNRGCPVGHAVISGCVTITCLTAVAFAGSGGWVEFVDESSTRIVANSSVGTGDTQEKDYAWGDVDKDGDIDLVCVRKNPFTNEGGRRNVLFMLEGIADGRAINGVLVDRTAQYVTDADDGGQGFLDLTNDRDVVLFDLNNDGWLDMVTAVTLSDGLPKTISHPRVYMNLKNNGQGEWLGFRYEESRTPQLFTIPGGMAVAPRFCSVAAGDVTGDGFADLYFGDYDGSGAGGEQQPPELDLNDRLWVNNGSAFFSDSMETRMTAEMLQSAFGMAVVIRDMNDDGVLDVVKDTALNFPQRVSISYNNPSNEGFFDSLDIIYNNSPYHTSIGDLNNDQRLDVVVTDDANDRYLLNQGNDLNNEATFSSNTFSFESGGDDGFGGNSVITDLDKDGFNDVIITDIDVDDPVAGRRMHIYRNLGNAPNVTLRELGGEAPWTPSVHDIAVYDLNGDTWIDMILGKRVGMEVWINRPPISFDFSYPNGIPASAEPDTVSTFLVRILGDGVNDPVPGTAQQHVSVNGGVFVSSVMDVVGSSLYEFVVPATSCGSRIRFYVSAEAPGGFALTDPDRAPIETYEAISSYGTLIALDDDFESVVPGWTVTDDPSLTGGRWERVNPNATFFPAGSQTMAQPGDDFGQGQFETMCYVTDQTPPGASAGQGDVDGGPTILTSPVMNLAGYDAIVTYARWFFRSTGTVDTLRTEVTTNGTDWVLVSTTNGTGSAWELDTFRLSDFVVPTATVRIRFVANDTPNDSVTEAAIDNVRVEKILCQTCETNEDCIDQLFCNGVERCSSGVCLPGINPCSQICDENNDACVECLVDSHCDDGLFCDGAEECVDTHCFDGIPPCQHCEEDFDACGDCASDVDCDDGLFCNGQEICVASNCVEQVNFDPCPGQLCDEIFGCVDCQHDDDCGEGLTCCDGNCLNDACVVSLQPRMGDPVRGLTRLQLDQFMIGKSRFEESLTASTGLGPIFNQFSCASCHKTAGVGGAGAELVTRFGFTDKGSFDPLDKYGGSLLQVQAISDDCREVVPPEANTVAKRRTLSIFGDGLIEAIPEEVILERQDSPPPGISGRAHMVAALEDMQGDPLRVGRFGWKAQLPTLLSFSADAGRNEMGLTNRLVPFENAPNGDADKLAACDVAPDPEDGPDGEGLHFIDRVTDFQKFLSPPPQTPRNGMNGEAIFNQIGCTDCHVAAYITGVVEEGVLSNKLIRPYSDFLLHDMGSLGDGIVQGDATETEFRTTPLWGVRARDPLLHDGRVAGNTLEQRIHEVVNWHAVTGSEAADSASSFQALDPEDKTLVIAFLDSLGRAEFDHDGDNVVTSSDFLAFSNCFERRGGMRVLPDDPCAISDVNQDEMVDLVDFELFLEAFDGTLDDCNGNDDPDLLELLTEVSNDVNSNVIPDECEPDCNSNGTPDSYDIATGKSLDCQGNTIPDSCDISSGQSADENSDDIPDECNVCVTDADCDDGVFCTSDRCGANECINSPILYGDLTSQAGGCVQDGIVDINDIFAAIDGFQNMFPMGCEFEEIDIAGAGSSCGGDGLIDISDIFAVIDAFQSIDHCCGRRN